ncbi:hypothetical protein DPX16_17356 [Anabarilius grahami]|uniref:Uncharacterized protein n=1 Tax=Anabarilius grahami TaxID=495550 RepID=A0A3N0XYR4_ANAGA|nr:hypothetical protein DPX16_17356 [Anabarilius grahami]
MHIGMQSYASAARLTARVFNEQQLPLVCKSTAAGLPDTLGDRGDRESKPLAPLRVVRHWAAARVVTATQHSLGALDARSPCLISIAAPSLVHQKSLLVAKGVVPCRKTPAQPALLCPLRGDDASRLCCCLSALPLRRLQHSTKSLNNRNPVKDFVVCTAECSAVHPCLTGGGSSELLRYQLIKAVVMVSYDGHDICPSCLGVQHLREAFTDPCLHHSLLPMLERWLCLAELDTNSTVKLGQLDEAPLRTRKHKASAAAGAPLPSKKRAILRSDEHSHVEENSLSKMVSVLFWGECEMSQRSVWSYGFPA